VAHDVSARRPPRPPRAVNPSQERNRSLLLAILKGDRERLHSLLPLEAPAEAELGRFLDRHGLAGFVYDEHRRRHALEGFSGELRRELRDAYLQQWMRSIEILSQLAELAKTFEAAGLEFLPLKGPLFSHRFYGDTDRRSTRDIDVLFRERDLDDVDAALAGAGFQLGSGILISRSLSRRFTHHFQYVRGPNLLEAHWKFANHPSFRIDYDRLWREREAVELGTGAFSVPSPEYSLVVQLLTIHKDLELGTFRVRSFVDVYEILASLGAFPWHDFLERRREERILRLSIEMLDLALEFLDARGEFPELDAELEAHGSLLDARGLSWRGLEIFEASPPALGNKRRTFRLYEAPLLRSCAWWAVSLPWRRVVYRPLADGLLRRDPEE
jgi:hypothetical protein